MRLTIFTGIACLVFSSAYGDSSVPSLKTPEPIFGGGVIEEGGTWQADVFTLVPLKSLLPSLRLPEDSVLFLEPHLGMNDGEASWSLGLGFRKLLRMSDEATHSLGRAACLFEEGWYFGGNVFLDGRQSEHGDHQVQASAGIELGSRYLSFHANYYTPLTDEVRIGERRVVRTLPSPDDQYTLHVGPAINLGPGSGSIHDIFVTGTRLRQDQLLTYGIFEEALRGWDADASVLVPGLDRYVDLRLVAGLYSYDDGAVGKGFNGWRAGIEFRPVPSLVLMASHFEDDRFSDGQWFAGFRFEIPLGTKPRDLLTPRKRSLEERLFEPVNRRSGPVLASGSSLEKTTRLPVIRKTISQEQLFVTFIPRPGDVIQLMDGSQFIVGEDGKTLRPTTDGQFFHSGVIMVIPEPTRGLLLLIGIVPLLRRRRVRP